MKKASVKIKSLVAGKDEEAQERPTPSISSSYFTTKKASMKFKQPNGDPCSPAKEKPAASQSPFKSYVAVNRAANRIKSMVSSSKSTVNEDFEDPPTDDMEAALINQEDSESCNKSASFINDNKTDAATRLKSDAPSCSNQEYTESGSPNKVRGNSVTSYIAAKRAAIRLRSSSKRKSEEWDPPTDEFGALLLDTDNCGSGAPKSNFWTVKKATTKLKQPKHVDDGTTADEDEEIDYPTSTLHATQSDTPPIADKLKADQVSEKRPNNSGSAPKDRLGTATAASKPSSYFTVKKATYKFKSVQENDLDDGNKADQEDKASKD